MPAAVPLPAPKRAPDTRSSHKKKPAPTVLLPPAEVEVAELEAEVKRLREAAEEPEPGEVTASITLKGWSRGLHVTFSVPEDD